MDDTTHFAIHLYGLSTLAGLGAYQLISPWINTLGVIAAAVTGAVVATSLFDYAHNKRIKEAK